MLKTETGLQNMALQETFVEGEIGQSPGVEEWFFILFLLSVFLGKDPIAQKDLSDFFKHFNIISN